MWINFKCCISLHIWWKHTKKVGLRLLRYFRDFENHVELLFTRMLRRDFPDQPSATINEGAQNMLKCINGVFCISTQHYTQNDYFMYFTKNDLRTWKQEVTEFFQTHATMLKTFDRNIKFFLVKTSE